MKKISFLIILFLFSLPLFADHLKGGWIYYEYLGTGDSPNTSKYKITVKQYIRCGDLDSAQVDHQVYLGIFDGSSYQLIQTETVPLTALDIESKSDFNCIANPPVVCYRVYQYFEIIDLPNNSDGYILSVQRCCRITGIINVTNSDQVGLTYTNKIPGIINGQSYRNNSSPIFAQKDTVIVCSNSPFTFDFSATDTDGDSLSYSFTDGLLGGNSSQTGAIPNPPTLPPPPYFPNAVIPYNPGYSGLSPLGSGVTINPVTGIISGIAPNTVGTYVVAVAVNEYRGGVLIGTTRKEIHIDVGNCNFVGADPVCSSCAIVTTSSVSYYTSCNSFTTLFANQNNSPLDQTYYWDFGVTSQTNDTSTLANPTFTYPDTGIYVITLIINRGQQCFDSTTTQLRVYPGFFPGFVTAGQCKNTQIQFTDTTKTNYGFVNSWSWDFGDSLSVNDSSHTKNPQHIYSAPGNYTVSLNVTNSKGCSSIITQTITITDKPDLQVTDDTLICSIDTLQLNAIGNGNFLWTPNYNINNQTSAAPLVSPKSPTTYYVTLTDPFGCKATDSVNVNVKQFVTVDAGPDQSICGGDSIQLQTVSDALHYKWSPSNFLNNDIAKYPVAFPPTTTEFYVIGNIGKCQSTDSVKIRVTPYPLSALQVDTTICFGDIIQFHATGGSIYSWSPAFFLNNSNIPDPIANPTRSIRYIVTVMDTLGCAKPVFDTIVVQVQKIIADAGPRDTSVVVNQPLQLNATGGQFYLWTPSIYLNDATIPNPVAIFNTPGFYNYVVKASSANSCFGTDTITVRVYKVIPGIYLPNAFTPNGDGLNDVFIPVAIGMKQINYFKIFNRWGQLVFSTTQQNKGWDGTFNSSPQSSGVFVWLMEGVDYQNNKITQKGTVMLVR